MPYVPTLGWFTQLNLSLGIQSYLLRYGGTGVAVEGPVVPSEKVLGSLGVIYSNVIYPNGSLALGQCNYSSPKHRLVIRSTSHDTSSPFAQPRCEARRSCGIRRSG